MFDNQRYMTRGIDENVDIYIQIVLWGMVDKLKKQLGDKTDYLQVFELKTDGEMLHITQRQEMPEYKTELCIRIDEKTIWDSLKIFVIDSGEYSTMLLAEEY